MKITIENKPENKHEFNSILDNLLDSKESGFGICKTFIDLRDLKMSWNHVFGFKDTEIGRGANHIWVSDNNGNRIIFVEF